MQGVWARLQPSVTSPLTPRRPLGSRPSVGVEQANLQSGADCRHPGRFSRGALRTASVGSSSHRSALPAQGVALRWEVLCVQELWGGDSSKSTVTEHPMAARQAPDGPLREELCVCGTVGKALVISQPSSHATGRPHVGCRGALRRQPHGDQHPCGSR